MKKIHLSCCILVALACNFAAADELLSLGSPAPTTPLDGFIQGKPIKEMSLGKVYVVEFSGTRCAPCVRAIPLMEQLQRKHASAVFVTVFSESKDAVREFLAGPGKAMTGRVLCDPEGNWDNGWVTPSGWIGDPLVFVVDAKGKIAWIGRPEGLAEPLAEVVAGKHSYAIDPVEKMQHAIVQQLVQRRRHLDELRNRVVKSEERVTDLIQGGKYAEALQTLVQDEDVYRELPNYVRAFRTRRLYVLGQMPDSHGDAFALACSIAADGRQKDYFDTVTAGHALLNHFQTCDKENRDKRMIHLAFALLGSSPDADLDRPEKIRQLSCLARAHTMDGNEKAAASAQKEIERLRAEQGKPTEE